MKNLKLLVVGDGGVGKSSLLISYRTDTFPSENVPTVIENDSAIIIADKTPYNIALWDTAGQEDYDGIRPLSYPGTDIVLVCFSVDNINSLENIKDKWVPELNKFIPNTPMILVGCKSDLRSTMPDTCIPVATIEQLATELEFTYYETSALTQDGVKTCFDNGIRHVLHVMYDINTACVD